MVALYNFLRFFLILLVLSSCEKASLWLKESKIKAERVNRYEEISLALLQENRLLKAEISKLTFDLSQKQHQLAVAMASQAGFAGGRFVASVSSPEEKLSFQKLLVKAKDFEKQGDLQSSLELYEKILKKKEALLSEEQGDSLEKIVLKVMSLSIKIKKYDLCLRIISSFEKEIKNTSYQRHAKLWKAIALSNSGKKKEAFNIFEEFRKRYKNTAEWKILAPHYEKIMKRYAHEK